MEIWAPGGHGVLDLPSRSVSGQSQLRSRVGVGLWEWQWDAEAVGAPMALLHMLAMVTPVS